MRVPTWSLALIAVSAFQLAAMAAEGQERTATLLFVGNDSIPPFIFMEDGKPAGLVVELAYAAAAKAGLSIRVQAMSWPVAQAKVAAGEADALLQINPTPEREKVYDFSEPLLESHFHIFRKSTRIDIQGLPALAGKRVGVQAGGFPLEYLKTFERIHPVILPSLKDGFRMLAQDEIDAVFVDQWVGEYALSLDRSGGVTVVEPPVVTGHSRIAVRKGNGLLLERINYGLQEINRDGTRERIQKRWKPAEVIYLSRGSIERLALLGALACIALLLLLTARTLARTRAIRRINSDLAEARDGLERRVSERTTELRAANASLRQGEERYRLLFAANPSPLWVFDEETLGFLAVNDAAVRAYGWSREEFLRLSLLDVRPPEEKDLAREIVRRNAGAHVAAIGAVRHRKKDGTVLTMEVTASTILFDGRPARLCLMKDISERLRAEEAVRQLHESLEQRIAERTGEVRRQADQLRSLASELSQAEQRERKRVAAILHDHIQQLLVAAQMQLAMVSRARPELIEPTVQGVASILKEATEASRSLAVELSPPILHQSGLASALAWLAARFEEKHGLTVHARVDREAEPALEPVRLLLFESVRELLLNAVKHAGARVARVTMTRTAEGWTRISVDDDGQGFDPAGQAARGGSGLGLFSIQQRLACLGGRIEIESARGKGTRAVLLAPPGSAVEPAAAPALAATGPCAGELPRDRRKIAVLLADDHRIIRQGLASILQLEPDLEVTGEAADGREAVELARSLNPDVVVMDINMPVMGGVEATRLIREASPRVRVIGLSMHVGEEAAAAMLQAGASGYMSKGSPSADLVEAIRACLRERS
jgi:PAS domain S-box-containing protein